MCEPEHTGHIAYFVDNGTHGFQNELTLTQEPMQIHSCVAVDE